MKKIKQINNFILILFIFSIIITSVFLYQFSTFYDFAKKSIDIEITNGIGTFIGGILGPLLSLIGSLLI
ncbi:hypothetical protein BWK58_07065, partial [Flavobacterium columnare]